MSLRLLAARPNPIRKMMPFLYTLLRCDIYNPEIGKRGEAGADFCQLGTEHCMDISTAFNWSSNLGL